MRIAILTGEPIGWHSRQLKRALRARGIEARAASLGACRVDLSGGCQGVVIPGFEDRLPDGALVRGVAGGALEQVTLRLDFLHWLRELGIPVYNEARAIEKTVDKAMTSLILRQAGVPTPPTWVCESQADARAVLLRETAAGHELVAKPLFGSQGVGLQRLRAGMDVPPAEECGNVWYLQRYVESSPDGNGGWRDWRVLVVGARAVAAMLRHGRSWINNVAQGARCEAAPLAEPLARLAEQAAAAIGIDYAGVDLIADREGALQVLEVNGIPAWRGLQKVTATNIAEILVDDFVTRRLARPLEAVCRA
ncbi:MAG TPA: RimK family alpha-L-glutamate ligase [Burkholderiales bacterium]